MNQAEMLKSIAECGFRFPVLSLVCREVSESAGQLSFLFPTLPMNRHENFFRRNFGDASVEYKQMHPWSSRNLTPEEESQLFAFCGSHARYTKNFAWKQFSLETTSKLVNSGENLRNILDGNAQYLLGILPEPRAPEKSEGQFCVKLLSDTAIGKKVLGDLKRSWEIHQDLAAREISLHPAQALILRGIISKISETISNNRKDLEDSIKEDVSMSGDHAHLSCLRILRTANLISDPTPSDFIRASFDPLALRLLHPLLDPTSEAHVKDKILLWMEFCVMEDKLGRILRDGGQSQNFGKTGAKYGDGEAGGAGLPKLEGRRSPEVTSDGSGGVPPN
jgi:hypothetical protein